jgi:homoserine kinase type II
MGSTVADEFSQIDMILKGFDLGELVSLTKNTRGTVNRNYVVETIKFGIKRKYFLRQYKNSIKPEDIEFEHSTIRGLIDRGVDFVARVHPTVYGQTYLAWQGPEDQAPGYYAVFDYLPGEDKYTWVNPRCTRSEYRSAAMILARFHQAAADLTPTGHRSEAGICELLPIIAEQVSMLCQHPKGTIFDSFLLENADDIKREIQYVDLVLSGSRNLGLPSLVIHCDYHPGNLKFSGKRVVGLLDFDWSKIDLRAFDVALASWYFFTNWKGSQAGSLRLDEMYDFLAVYQKTLSGGGGLQPLNGSELELLPILLRAANLYVLNWALDDYYRKNVNPDEYCGYLKHNVESLNWLRTVDFSAITEPGIDQERDDN